MKPTTLGVRNWIQFSLTTVAFASISSCAPETAFSPSQLSQGDQPVVVDEPTNPPDAIDPTSPPSMPPSAPPSMPPSAPPSMPPSAPPSMPPSADPSPEPTPDPNEPPPEGGVCKHGKMMVCHVPLGNPSARHEICVSPQGAEHGHGMLELDPDYIGGHGGDYWGRCDRSSDEEDDLDHGNCHGRCLLNGMPD